MFSSSQLLELLVVICTIDHSRYALAKIGDALTLARATSGPVRPDSMPTRASALITPLQGLVYFLFPAVYVLSVVAQGLHQPAWMQALALPDAEVTGWKNALRLGACVASVALQTLSDGVFAHLGDQFHLIGRREKSRIVQTGPFAWVRHPLYALSLVQVALWSLMFWSYAPLFAVGTIAAVYAVKISIEEQAILQDDAVKDDYRAYMRKVPAKLVPFVW